MIRRRVYVSGRVQGVWFRESTRRRAETLGLRGWVRNLGDGRVEALFEGDEDAVQAAIEYVHRGPEHAQVTDVQVEPADTLREGESPRSTGFEVR